MPHLYFFCFEVPGVVRIYFAANRHLLDHLHSVALKSDHFLWIIGQETKFAHAKIEENLRPEAVIAQISRKPELRVCFHGIESFLLQFVSVNFCRETDAASFLPHVNKNSVAFLRNLPQRGVQLISAIAAARSED